MTVGIVCAGDEELAPFLGLVKDWKITERAMLKFYQGAFNGMGIFLGGLQTGGKVKGCGEKT